MNMHDAEYALTIGIRGLDHNHYSVRHNMTPQASSSLSRHEPALRPGDKPDVWGWRSRTYMHRSSVSK